MAKKMLHHRIGVRAQVNVHAVIDVACNTQVFWTPVHLQVCKLHRCRLTSVYISPQGVLMLSCVRNLFISVWDSELGDSASLQ